MPLIRIVPPPDPGPLQAAAARLDAYDWLVFTSANAVAALADAVDPATWSARVAVVGEATAAAVSDLAIRVAVMPETKDAAALAAALAASDPIAGRRILWPRAEAARTVLLDRLAADGAHVDAPVAYRTEPDPEAAEDLAGRVRAGRVDVLTFTSPSAVRSYSEAGGPIRGTRVAVIGPVTGEAVRRHGMTVDIEPAEPTAERLAAAITDALRRPD